MTRFVPPADSGRMARYDEVGWPIDGMKSEELASSWGHTVQIMREKSRLALAMSAFCLR